MTLFSITRFTFVFPSQRKSLDIALGFAAGVMIAASFWSLLAPAIDLAESSGSYGHFAFLPVAGGFLLGAIFVFGTDKLISYLGINSPTMLISLTHANKDKADIAMDDTENCLKYDKTGATGKCLVINAVYLLTLNLF